jgi:hypothetical protein
MVTARRFFPDNRKLASPRFGGQGESASGLGVPPEELGKYVIPPSPWILKSLLWRNK